MTEDSRKDKTDSDSDEITSETDGEDPVEIGATSPPDVGEIFTCKLQKVNSSGNGIVSDDFGGLNIGPVDKSVVGEEIKIKRMTRLYGICLSEKAISDDYASFIQSIAKSTVSDDIGSSNEVISQIINIIDENSDSTVDQTNHRNTVNSINNQIEEDEILVGEIDRISESGNGIVSIQDDRDYINIGKVTEESIGEKVRVQVGGEPSPRSGYCLTNEVIPDDTNIRLPPIGTIFTTNLTRVSNSGNGIIEGQIYSLNIGPVAKVTGKAIKIKRIHQNWGVCLTDRVRLPDYVQSFASSLPSEFDSKAVSEMISKEEENSTDPGNDTHSEDSLGSSYCVASNENPDIPKSQGTEPELELGSSSGKVDSEGDVPGPNNLDSKDTIPTQTANKTESKSNVVVEKPEKTEVTTKSSITTDDQSDKVDVRHRSVDSQELVEKRQRAEEAANKSPKRDIERTVGSNYSRSPAIKDYAKARANGVCEYCKEPAPFETDDGEPYLEAHHVDELGEGGEDHPDKVVALCPSCHKEIHYGQRGDKINQNLRERLDNGLAKVSK